MYPRTPTRTGERTPQRTPTRATSRTPTRHNTTPLRISSGSRPTFKAPRGPDFTSIAHQQIGNIHDSFFAYNPEKEPIKAYLRIRPQSAECEPIDATYPYLHIVDDLEVSMTPPKDSNAYRTRNRAPERYKFSKIFTDNVSQQEFFNKTTLPLIHDVLRGENALIFAYGVTNSGKTFSVMGTRQQPGILPRTLDVIFNSIDDYCSDSKVKPCMHSLVQKYTDPADENRDILQHIPHYSPIIGSSSPDVWDSGQPPVNRDNTSIAIDQHFEYGIWVSFAEIYTEKIYDLLVPPDRLKKRKALSLKYEYSSGHKYIAGLKEVRVKSIEEAYAILFEGQRNRAEYSTITNHTSSRSHSIFTIRIVRVPIDENDYIIEDPVYATVSKFSIVDLAGSERYRNTLNSGQRLKEAGNINKSLMVLGQCMETLRLNQLKSAVGKRGAMVPYRHSKLTELFKSSFEGDGKAVMVVNVNPFDTGFDENSHVMKFAAVAKDVATWRRVHPKLELGEVSQMASKRRRTNAKSQKVYHGIDALMKDEDGDNNEEDEEDETQGDVDDTDDEDEDEEDPFVDNLIAQLDDLRNKWIEAETRCATMETEIRQQVTQETEVELKKMEELYITFLKKENDQTDTQIKEKLAIAELNNDQDGSYQDILQLQDKQSKLAIEMDKLCIHLNEHEATKHSLLEKIARLEKDQQRHKDELYRLNAMVKERDTIIESLNNEKRRREEANTAEGTSDPMSIDVNPLSCSTDQSQSQPEPSATIATKNKKSAAYEEFLELRKRLRRSIFRGEEYSHDADVIMSQVEQFKGVTFDLVKETNMGKLMKLITQHKFTNDPYHIQDRSRALFKQYAKLSLPILAPKKTGRESMIVLSVNAGREEELITEMRNAMSTLQDENGKLKQKLKLVHEGHRRLKEAFEKTRQESMSFTASPITTTSSIELEEESSQQQEETALILEEGASSDLEMVMFSPILGATVPQAATSSKDDLTANGLDLDDDELESVLPKSPSRTKKRRKLRSLQLQKENQE